MTQAARHPVPAASFPAGTLADLPDLLREFGLDGWGFLENHGITAALLAQPLTPLPAVSYGRLIEAAAQATGCAHLGLLLGQRARLENAGPLRHLLLHAPNLRACLDGLLRFTGLWYPALGLHAAEEGGYMRLSLQMDSRIPGRTLILSAYVTALNKHLETLLGRSWRPSQVSFGMPAPEQDRPYRQYFRAPVLFGEPVFGLVFPSADLALTRTQGDAQLGDFLQQHLEQLATTQRHDFSGQVTELIRALLPSGECSVDRVAQYFAMHRFTLYRHLQAAGVDFASLLDGVRRERALELLATTSMPIADVALQLGYAGANTFGRACQRWTGLSPLAWRQQYGRPRLPHLRRARAGSAA